VGGNALKEFDTRRMPSWDAHELGALIDLKLSMMHSVEGGYCSVVIPSYRSKLDYGDIDILVRAELFAKYSAQDIADKIGAMVGSGAPLVWKRNGPVLSLGVPLLDGGVFQVDLISAAPEWFDFALNYLSFNDAGNLMGRVAHRMGLKFGHDGLWLPLRDGAHLYRTTPVTRDFKQAIEFLGFDHARWRAGFDALENIYRFIADGKRFNRELFPLEHRSHRARVRDAKRPTYTGFLRWLEAHPEIPDRIEYPEGNNWLPEIFSAFPELEPSWLWAQQDLALSKAAKRRFNGELVSRLTGTEGRDLGSLMAKIREGLAGETGLRERVISLSERELTEIIHRFAEQPESRLHFPEERYSGTDDPGESELDGMVFIAGGSFLMGSPENEKGRYDDERQHREEVGDFLLGKHPVTNAEYRRFKPAHDSGSGFNDDDQPVVRVSWHDATAYAEWLSQETGEDYRLPTEAEWEYACRTGATARFFFGDDADDLGDYAWFEGNSGEQTRPVGQKQPNKRGLHDMLGNVWEWTGSVYDEDYGGAETLCADVDDDSRRVLRGGSWSSSSRLARAAVRSYYSPGSRIYYIGFRLALLKEGAP